MPSQRYCTKISRLTALANLYCTQNILVLLHLYKKHLGIVTYKKSILVLLDRIPERGIVHQSRFTVLLV
jgi:hypothetical protein